MALLGLEPVRCLYLLHLLEALFHYPLLNQSNIQQSLCRRWQLGSRHSRDALPRRSVSCADVRPEEYQNQGMRVVRAFLLCNSRFISFLFVRGRYKPDMNVIML